MASSRRQFLTTTVTTSILGLATLTARERARRRATQPSADVGVWPMFHRGRRNTGATDRDGPGASSTVEWGFEPGGPAVGSPVVAGNTVCVVIGDTLMAFAARTGEIRWQFTPSTGQQAGLTTPAVIDDTVYVSLCDTVYALRRATGDQRWQFTTGATVQSPTIWNGSVYVGNEDGQLYAVAVADGTEQWRVQTDGAIRGVPAVARETVYIGSEAGTGYALEAATGEQEWTVETTGAIVSSPAVGRNSHLGRTVYLGSTDGQLYALDGATGAEHWRAGFDDAIAFSPTVTSDVVYIVTGLRVMEVDARTGRSQLRYRSPRVMRDSPVVAGDQLYISSRTSFDGIAIVARSPAVGTDWLFASCYTHTFEPVPVLVGVTRDRESSE